MTILTIVIGYLAIAMIVGTCGAIIQWHPIFSGISSFILAYAWGMWTLPWLIGGH